MALIAAESTTIAKPVCTQIMMTISRKVFSGAAQQPVRRDSSTPSHSSDLLEQADLGLAWA